MSTDTGAACPYGADRPADTDGPRPAHPGGRIPLYGEEFSRDPRATYRRLRALGPIAPVDIAPGVPGFVTTTYRAALHLLRNTPGTFAKDPRTHWRDLAEGRIAEDCPALPMMQPRDNALFIDGDAHTRLRRTITDSLASVDTRALTDDVGRIGDSLIDRFAARGSADLIAEYADALPALVLIEMFGSPPELGRRIVVAIGKLFDGSDPVEANAEVSAACLELTRLKRSRPAADVTSRLAAHPEGLTDEEMIQQLLLLVGAGSTPSTNLIANALLLMIEDEQFSGNVYAGTRPVGEALDQVLWEDPPVSNYCPLYARRTEYYDGVEIPAGVPVLVSFAAANSDPSLAVGAADRTGNRAHLAFSAGSRSCPAPDIARIMSEAAVERVLDRLPDLELACPADALQRRPGTFHSGWTSLPVTFTPVRAREQRG